MQEHRRCARQLTPKVTSAHLHRRCAPPWANTYGVGTDYTATATRCGNAVYNRHRAPASRHLRLLGGAPNLRAAAFRHSAAEVGVEGLAAVAMSPTAATTLAGLSFNRLDGITDTSRGLLLDAQKGFAFVVNCS